MKFVEVKIKSLAECMEFSNIVAGWLYEEWIKGKVEFDELSLHMKHFAQKEGLPKTFIAFYGKKPVGTVSLWRNDLPLRQDLTPWLAGLWVTPDFRGNFVGHQLVYHTIKEAKKQNYKKLFLVTDIVGFYEKMGFKFEGKEPKTINKKVSLYSFETKNKNKLKELIENYKGNKQK
jgi:ribosomal protein S18 acetylase RimI-like enzyme